MEERATSSAVYCRSRDVRRSSRRASHASMPFWRVEIELLRPVIAEVRVPVVLSLAVLATCSTRAAKPVGPVKTAARSEEHTSELQSLMRISYAVFCLKKIREEHE